MPPGGAPIEIARTRTFTEAPVFDNAGTLYFTHNEGIAQVSSDGRQSDWVNSSEAGFNGHKVLPDGRHLVCASRKSAIWLLDANAEFIRAVSRESEGVPLRAPNDLTLDAAGGFYFTDPGGSRAAPIGTVHYVDRSGATYTIAGGFQVPNGLVLTPDNKFLYVAETVPNRILRFPVLRPGKLGPMAEFAGLPDTGSADAGPDGLTIDGSGNIFAAHLGAGQVIVLDSRGKLLHKLPTGLQDTSNVAIRERQLYVTGSVGHRSKTEGRVVRIALR